MRELLRSLLPLLPERLHAHVALGLEEVLAARYRPEWEAEFLKMGLLDPSRLPDAAGAAALTLSDAEAATALYQESMPENAFYPEALGTLPYSGVWEGSRLVTIAGTHVYSERYRVAVLGNITTHPDYRGRGYARAAVAALCAHLLAQGIQYLGLNVRADNAPALACYRRVGFKMVCQYRELVTRVS